MEPGSSWWYPGTGQESMGTRSAERGVGTRCASALCSGRAAAAAAPGAPQGRARQRQWQWPACHGEVLGDHAIGGERSAGSRPLGAVTLLLLLAIAEPAPLC